jgi:hypothetical protein
MVVTNVMSGAVLTMLVDKFVLTLVAEVTRYSQLRILGVINLIREGIVRNIPAYAAR